MNFQPKRARRQNTRTRIALIGVAGSGKTLTALRMAKHIGGRWIVLDTEHGRSHLYSDLFDFDVIDDLTDFHPKNYTDFLIWAQQAGYDGAIIDSLSHAWAGAGGALELVDRSKKLNKFAAWGDVTPHHNRLIDTIVGAGLHIIATMRQKAEYILTDDGRGKTEPRKIGMAPIQRDNMDFEFDVIGELDGNHRLTVTKTRCSLLDGKVYPEPDAEPITTYLRWLHEAGEPVPGSAEKQTWKTVGFEPAVAQSPGAPTPVTAKHNRDPFLNGTREEVLRGLLDDARATGLTDSKILLAARKVNPKIGNLNALIDLSEDEAGQFGVLLNELKEVGRG